MFCDGFLELDSNSRLLLIAPHPDDEALGCSIVLQRAVRAGAAIQVVYATDGDDNPWPHRLMERKWHLHAADRKRWGQLRRGEALAALCVFGVPPSDVSFLGLPDQGVTNLLVRDCRLIIERFVTIIRDRSPTHLLVPSAADIHPDHNALAVMLRLALAEFSPGELNTSVWSYAIHGQSGAFFERARQVRQSEAEITTKIRAIQCHKTQLQLSRRRFLAYAARPERFVLLSSPEPTTVDGAVRSISRQAGTLELDLCVSFKPASSSTPRLFLFGHGEAKAWRCIAIQLPARSSRIEMRDAASGRRIGMAEYRGNASTGTLTIPINIFSREHALFVKTERRGFRFFDEAGWLEIPGLFQPELVLSSSVEWPSSQFVRHTPLPEKVSIRAGSSGPDQESARSPRRWAFLFTMVLLWLGTFLSANIQRPWINALDYNGAVWSQSAHNILRAGLSQTSGASSGFYFGPLPIPAWGYYLHHPPLLHLVITGLFVIFGEHEWVARLLPIGCSLTSAILLWLLVRSCAGSRTATLSAAVFACLPMELRYGQMVNFEPCVLMFILGALLCLRYWSLSGNAFWQYGALAVIFVGLWVDWAMYIFVFSLCVCLLVRSPEGRRFARVLAIAAILSAAVYLIRIRLLRPDACENLTHALIFRVSSSGSDRFTEFQWIKRVLTSLIEHFLPLGWILATAGALITFRSRNSDEGRLWLFRACVCIFIMDAVFVGVFQNDSFIHQYISFYFVAPVAIMGGIALDRLIKLFQHDLSTYNLARAGQLSACMVLLALGMRGTSQAKALQLQFHILDYKTVEPPTLIPELGNAIQEDFPPGTCVLCNFLPEYGPQFAYYAQRDILNNLSDYRYWRRYLKDSAKPIGGVIWMTPKGSQDLIAKLPPGNKRFLRFGGLSFCFWERNLLPAKRPVAKIDAATSVPAFN